MNDLIKHVIKTELKTLTPGDCNHIGNNTFSAYIELIPANNHGNDKPEYLVDARGDGFDRLGMGFTIDEALEGLDHEPQPVEMSDEEHADLLKNLKFTDNAASKCGLSAKDADKLMAELQAELNNLTK